MLTGRNPGCFSSPIKRPTTIVRYARVKYNNMELYLVLKSILCRFSPVKWLQLGRMLGGGLKNAKLSTSVLWTLIHILLINAAIIYDITLSEMWRSTEGGEIICISTATNHLPSQILKFRTKTIVA